MVFERIRHKPLFHEIDAHLKYPFSHIFLLYSKNEQKQQFMLFHKIFNNFVSVFMYYIVNMLFMNDSYLKTVDFRYS